ncbi:MAG TPA: hypothetical protein VFF73_32105, partial [Planctomycetota bacterium]|nr:hypothetical protein [Planctomycetota bacterium]
LEHDPHDPFALEVKGVLVEPASRDQALGLYDEAGKVAGDAGAPGRWNAARLRGVAREKRPPLPPGYAAFSRAPDGPIRQLVSLEDHRIAIDVGALGPEYAHAVLASLVGGGPRLYAFADTAGSLAGGLEWAVRALARVLLVAALLHLPFATRPSLPVEEKWGRVARWVDLALPGTLDLARGRMARGATILGLTALLALLALAGLRGGILESMATPLPPLATTFAPEAHSLLFRPAWLATMGHAALLLLAVVYVTHWIAPFARKRVA